MYQLAAFLVYYVDSSFHSRAGTLLFLLEAYIGRRVLVCSGGLGYGWHSGRNRHFERGVWRHCLHLVITAGTCITE